MSYEPRYATIRDDTRRYVTVLWRQVAHSLSKVTPGSMLGNTIKAAAVSGSQVAALGLFLQGSFALRGDVLPFAGPLCF